MGPSETISSLVIEIVSKSVQVPLGEPQDVASSSGMALELPILSSADSPVLIVLLILLVVLPRSLQNLSM